MIGLCTLKVVELEDRIKDLLYDDVSTDEEDYVEDKEGNERKEDKEDKEDKERRKHEASEEEDLKSILLAVDLSWERIGLMERRGFKVSCVSRNFCCCFLRNETVSLQFPIYQFENK